MKPPAAIARGEEPPMFLQRPSTGKSQDVRHILAKTFRQLYTRDTISPDTVKNLSVSKGGDDEYHERYVEMLQKVHSVDLDYLKHRYFKYHWYVKVIWKFKPLFIWIMYWQSVFIDCLKRIILILIKLGIWWETEKTEWGCSAGATHHAGPGPGHVCWREGAQSSLKKLRQLQRPRPSSWYCRLVLISLWHNIVHDLHFFSQN